MVGARADAATRPRCARDQRAGRERRAALQRGGSRPQSGDELVSESTTKTILHVVGARPNYMKIAPLMDALRAVPGVRQVLVNTGQHYDEAMAKGFIRELSLPMPDRDLEVGSASHAVQTANVMT